MLRPRAAPAVSKAYEDLELQWEAYSKLSARSAAAAQTVDQLREQLQTRTAERDDAWAKSDVLQREAAALRRQMAKMAAMPAEGFEVRWLVVVEHHLLNPCFEPACFQMLKLD